MKYEVKALGTQFRVWDNESANWITKDVPSKEVADKICQDFNAIDKDVSHRDENEDRPEPGEISAEEFFGNYDFGLSVSDLPEFYKAVELFASLRVQQTLRK